MTRWSARIAGVLVMIGALTSAAAAQTRATDMKQAPGGLPSGMGDAIDRDVAKVRDATAKFKASEAAEAAGYKRVTECVENQPAGAMGYHFQNNALLDTTLDVAHPEVLVYEKKAERLGIWYLHVWTWEPSPSGLFADWNPKVKCAAGPPMPH